MISKLRNLGPASEAMLADAGIVRVEQLRSMGAVAAYRAVLKTGTRSANLNLLWALYGALEDIDCRMLREETKQQLRSELSGRPLGVKRRKSHSRKIRRD